LKKCNRIIFSIELYPNSVFWYGIGWYFLGIFLTDTKGKLGKDLWYHTFGENPFFAHFCPLFDGPSPPFEGSSRKISQNGAPAKSFSTKIPYIPYQIYQPASAGNLPIPAKLPVNRWDTTLFFSAPLVNEHFYEKYDSWRLQFRRKCWSFLIRYSMFIFHFFLPGQLGLGLRGYMQFYQKIQSSSLPDRGLYLRPQDLISLGICYDVRLDIFMENMSRGAVVLRPDFFWSFHKFRHFGIRSF
jgi:hypothetical protein